MSTQTGRGYSSQVPPLPVGRRSTHRKAQTLDPYSQRAILYLSRQDKTKAHADAQMVITLDGTGKKAGIAKVIAAIISRSWLSAVLIPFYNNVTATWYI